REGASDPSSRYGGDCDRCSVRTLYRCPQLPNVDDRKSRGRAILPEQRDAIDREVVHADRSKAIAQHGQYRLASLRSEPAGQRHVEAEFPHHVRIAPAVEIIALSRRQLV